MNSRRIVPAGTVDVDELTAYCVAVSVETKVLKVMTHGANTAVLYIIVGLQLPACNCRCLKHSLLYLSMFWVVYII